VSGHGAFDPALLPALKAAFRFLKSRDRFGAEVRTHLIGEGFEEPCVEEVVSYLIERKLINDNKTTQSLIERNSGKRSVGIERLRAELERLGAPEETVEANLAGLGESESERALEALRTKYKSGADRAKAGRFLYSRGFREEAIEAALEGFCGPLSFPE
jgi:SOS response regulatory protein OraA/RecX